MKLLLKILISLVASLLGLTAFYVLVALLLSVVPVNKEEATTTAEDSVEVYITTNGVHADFRLPVATSTIDWRDIHDPQDYRDVNPGFGYIAFGWGDKGFYLDTPQWSDLTFSTAANAILLPSPTAMHVTYYRSAPGVGEDSRRIYLSREQYQQLVGYIRESFERTAEGNILLIKGAGYSGFDNFYEAKGSYSLFYTCNNWVNEGLKKIGVKTSLWTPFDWGILYHLE